ncbi:MAG: helix-turn-helix transcriptional regulator [Gemmatimonadaceae bacterium]
MAEANERRLLNTEQASVRLGLRPQTLNRWRVEGCGPVWMKLGGRCMYDVADLNAYLDAQRRRSTSDKGGANEPDRAA